MLCPDRKALVATFNFYLKDSGTSAPATWGEGDRYEIGNQMKALFDDVCAEAACPFDNSDFWWDPTGGDIPLLIYFVDGQADSLVRRIRPHANLGGGGTTHVSPTGNLAEVYISGGTIFNDSAAGLGRLAFHEAMHNLLNMGNNLHAVGGGGLASAVVFENTNLTQRNKALMAPALGRKVAQNTTFL